jgi:predicted CoA-binding protein
VPGPVEFVDVFRRPQFCADVARDAAAVGAKVIWLQSGITSDAARRIAEDAGMTYVEDRCVMVEHRRHGIGRVE